MQGFLLVGYDLSVYTFADTVVADSMHYGSCNFIMFITVASVGSGALFVLILSLGPLRWELLKKDLPQTHKLLS